MGRISTTTFLAEPMSFVDQRVTLVGDEARHASVVLRVGEGDMIRVVDGSGRAVIARVKSADRSQVVAEFDAVEMESGESPRSIRMFFCMTKKRNRLEFLVEKLVELGVAELFLVESERSERSAVSNARLQRVVRAATKQSGRSRFMHVVPPQSIEQVMQSNSADAVFVCHERASSGLDLRAALEGPVGESIDLWIGPEGGFTEPEIESLKKRGATIVGLGPRRLRSETAGIAATAIVVANMHEETTPYVAPEST